MNIKNKGLKKATGIFLSLLMLAYLLPIGQVFAKEAKPPKVYVDGVGGHDDRDGSSSQNAFASYEKAVEAAARQKAVILVSGTLTVSKDTTWKYKISRSEEFKGLLVEVKEGVTLTTEGFSLKKEDYKGNVTEKKITENPSVQGQNTIASPNPAPSDEAAKDQAQTPALQENQAHTQEPLPREAAPKQEALQKEAAKEVVFPESLTMQEANPLGALPILGENVSGDGVFSWKDAGLIPQAYENSFEMVFTPNDTRHYDYSSLNGWQQDSQTLVRSVKVYVNALKPQEPAPLVPSQPKENEAPIRQEASQAEMPKDTQAEKAVKEEQAPASSDNAAKASNAKEGQNTGESSDIEKVKEAAKEQGVLPADNVSKEDSAKRSDMAKETDKKSLETDKKEPAKEARAEEDKQETDENKPAKRQDLPLKEKEVEIPVKVEATFQEDSIINHVEAMICALPNQIGSDEDVYRVVNAGKALASLTASQQARVSASAQDYLRRVQELCGIYNRSNQGVSVVGNLPWYVKLKVSFQEDVQTYEKPNVDTIITPYEISLYDLMKDEAYHLQGEKVQLTLPAPDPTLYNRLVIVHYTEDGGIEYITPIMGENTISFMTSSFSPFHIAGSKVLAGGNVVSGSYGKTSSLLNPAGLSASAKTEDKQGASTGAQTSVTKKKQSSVTGTKKTKGSAKSGLSKASQSKTSESKVSKAAKTGDRSPVVLYAVLGIFALIALLVLYIKRIKDKRR